jgi:aspartate kinase
VKKEGLQSGAGAPRATGIVKYTDLAEIGVLEVPDHPGVAGEILATLSQHDINVPFLVELTDPAGLSSLVLAVHLDDLYTALDVIRPTVELLRANRVVRREGMGVAVAHGPHFRERAGCASIACRTIAQAGINILAISTSLSSISFLVTAPDIERTVAALQKAFDVQNNAVVIAKDGLSRPAKPVQTK